MAPEGPGRPQIGPMVNVRLPQDLIDALDRMADDHTLTRAAMIRLLLADGVETGGTFATAEVQRILGAARAVAWDAAVETVQEERTKARRCVGGYKSVDAPVVGLMRPPKAACPSCGRVIAFHWSTGKFRTHDRPSGGEGEGGKSDGS